MIKMSDAQYPKILGTKTWYAQYDCCIPIHVPPSVSFVVAEGAVYHTGYELTPGDEQGVQRDKSATQVDRRTLRYIHRYCHGGKAW